MRAIIGRMLFCVVFIADILLFAAQPRKPNILLIMADDLGFSDIGCYGGEISTPNLDRLAQNGLRFTQFYNTARCWPTRGSILSGYYAQQIRRDSLPGIRSGASGRRPAWALMLPEMLKHYGYRTYHSGKWHIDGPVLSAGFDRSYSLEDHDRKFYPRNHTLDDKRLPPVKEADGYYTATAVADYAIGFLSEHQTNYSDKPFFLFLAFTEPHFPLQALQQDIDMYKDRYKAGWDALRLERYKRIKKLGLADCGLPGLEPDVYPSWNLPQQRMVQVFGEGECGRAIPWKELTAEQKAFQPIKMAIHAAMVHRMDIEIGRVLEKLRLMGVFEDTVIFFLSDNGASAEMIVRGDGHDTNAAPGSAKTFLSLGPGWSSAANTPFRLHKSWVHEGGISTPFIVHWGNGIIKDRGGIRKNPGHLIDFVPTVLDLVSGSVEPPIKHPDAPPLPGKSLVPVFYRDNSVSHDYLWWYHDGNKAIRVGDWKLVCDHKKPWELYNLKKDRAESKDLASRYPEKVRELSQKWESILNEFIAQATKDLDVKK
ncbi:MAG: arylsulfatase [Verrucomicrobiia bacterium]